MLFESVGSRVKAGPTWGFSDCSPASFLLATLATEAALQGPAGGPPLAAALRITGAR